MIYDKSNLLLDSLSSSKNHYSSCRYYDILKGKDNNQEHF